MSKKYENKLERKEIWKQIKGSNSYQRKKINPKVFAIPVLTVVNTMQSE